MGAGEIDAIAADDADVRSRAFRGTSRFEIAATLGEGAVGVVYEAFDRETSSRVALKVLRTRNAEALLLLKNEFRSAADLHHTNLVQLGELLEESGDWFFTMELLRGVDVLSYVREGGALDLGRLRGALVQLMVGLGALHEANKVHCDIKPSNVMVTPEGRLVVLDFGIVSDLARGGVAHDRGMLGTAAYMAPEQVLSERLGPAVDVYAAGAVLYLALTGQLPFGDSPTHALEAKLSAEPRSPKSLAPTIPDDLNILCIEMLRVDPAARPRVSEILERLGASSSARMRVSVAPSTWSSHPAIFVGRREELAELHSAWVDVSQARPPRGRTVVLEGESGVGKSYLAAELVQRCRAETPELLVLRGRCYERESVAYKAIDGVIDELVRFLAERAEREVQALLPPEITRLRPIFQVIDHIPAIARLPMWPTEDDVYTQRTRAIDVLRAWLMNVAARWPTIVVIDDLQWANADSVGLLEDVMRAPRAPPLLLLATRRAAFVRANTSEGPAPMPSLRPTSDGDISMLRIGNLSPSDAHRLARKLLEESEAVYGAVEDADAVAKGVAYETAGHPLFIEEVLRTAGRTSKHDVTLGPMHLDDALWSRVQRLDAKSRDVLELVALSGLPLAHSLVGESLGIGAAPLAQILAGLRAHKLARTSGIRKDDVVEPYHDRVRESVVAHLTSARRRELHGILARALASGGAAPPDLLATHWHGADDDARAGLATLDAADRAAAALAFEYASTLYERAIRQGLPDPTALWTVEQRLADSLRNAGRGVDAARAFERAAKAAPREKKAALRRTAAEELLMSGLFVEGRAALKKVLAHEGVSLSWTPLTSIVFGLVRRGWLRIRGLGVAPYDPSAPLTAADARLLHTMDVLWGALRGLAMVDATLLFDMTVRLVLLALRAREPRLLARYLAVESMSLSSWGTPKSLARAETLATMCGERAAESPDKHTRGMHAAARAFVTFYRGQWPATVGLMDEATAAFREHGAGITWETTVSQQYHQIALFRSGKLALLRERSTSLLRDARRRGDLFATTTYVVGYPSLTFLQTGDVDHAREEIAVAMARWPKGVFLYQHYHAWMAEVLADIYVGNWQSAWARVDASWQALEGAFLLVFPEIAYEAFHVRARAAVGLARTLAPDANERASLLARAAADARRLAKGALAWPKGNAAAVEAALCNLRGDAGGARSALRSAIAHYEGSAMALYAAAASRALGLLTADDEGAAMVARADARFRAEGVVDPARAARVFATGLGDDA